MTEQLFVAHEREIAQLQTFLDRALAGNGQVCFVTGEAGAGKTALVAEFAHRTQAVHPDLIVAVGQGDAQAGIGDPYLPFREILIQLTGDVEAKLAQGVITEENAGRLRDFLRVSDQVLVDLGPDLIDIVVSVGRGSPTCYEFQDNSVNANDFPRKLKTEGGAFVMGLKHGSYCEEPQR